MNPYKPLIASMIAALFAVQVSPACEILHQTHVEMSPNGERLLLVVGRRDLKVLTSEGTVVTDEGPKGRLTATAFSHDGRQLALCLEDAGLVVLREGAGEARLESSGQCSSLAWSREGRLSYVLTSREGRAGAERISIKLWNSRDGTAKTLHTTKVEPPVNATPSPSQAQTADERMERALRQAKLHDNPPNPALQRALLGPSEPSVPAPPPSPPDTNVARPKPKKSPATTPNILNPD